MILFGLLAGAQLLLPLARTLPYLNVISGLAFMAILSAGGMWTIARPGLRKTYLIAVLVGMGTTLARGLGEALVSVLVWNGYHAVLFGLTAVSVVAWIIRQREVTVDTIFAALSGFYLFGFSFGLIYSAVALVSPGAFNLGADSTLQDFFYFSFVTLTTLGYGDIVPLQPFSRSLVTLEALTGQIYLVVLVARLVSLATPVQGKGENSRGEER